ncbi:MAG: mannonate dehydratase [Promethearchaeota archaeon Loki_b32]|nr:MAG: mannonate dehydratase [Candidatus Lokiarchaeota archaeon Loki_b32]
MREEKNLNEDRLKFIKQLGVDDVVIHTPRLPGEKQWEFDDLLNLRRSVEGACLRLGAIENVPKHFYEGAMLGLPERDEQIECMQNTIRNMGKAGVPVFGYHWVPNSVWRTTPAKDRGDATATSFDYDEAKDRPLTHGREYTAEEMWDNYTRFIKAVAPVAEEAGVRMALHPDDPPVESLGGIARIFGSFEAFKRGTEIVDSDYNGLEFCQGCWAEMGEDVCEVIRYFGKKIFYVHFRDVVGTVPKFRESFIDSGDTDMYKAMRAYKESGFKGILIPDHGPNMVKDIPWSYIGRGYAIG